MDEDSQIQSRLASLEAASAQLADRLEQIESRIAELSRVALDQQSIKRFVEMKTGRSGEMSTRIAQRLAKCEAAIEILARSDDPEAVDQD